MYPMQVTPVAINLIKQLTEKFHEYYKPGIDDSDPNHKENQELYTNCINTLYNIINAIKANAPLMGEAWTMVKSVLDRVFVQINIEPECLSNASDLLHLIIFNVPPGWIENL